jgi:predicted phosphodiesterase
MLFKKILKSLLTKPVIALANRYSSAPDKEKVFSSLSKLYAQSREKPGEKNSNLFRFDPKQQSVIIFSDQHKGTRNGSDDFATAEANYIAALEYYDQKKFYYVNLGDCEELWENGISGVMKYNKAVFDKEKLFVDRNSYCKIIGNHDLYWTNDPFAQLNVKKIYDQELKVFEGILLRVEFDSSEIDIFCTHGHQGDTQSDGNAFSKWFVSNVWGPLQMFLEINPNTPSTNDQLKSLHNQMMYQWAVEQPKLVLITGHTHQPVFKSLTHLERLYLQLEEAKTKNDLQAIDKITAEIPRRQREFDFVNHSFQNMIPSYFNSGCCCFADGTITGIEISEGVIRLIKWSYINNAPTRTVAEEESLAVIAAAVK